MVAHHLISVAAWPYALLAGPTTPGNSHWFLLVFLAYECSTPFVLLRGIIDRLFGKGALYAANAAQPYTERDVHSQASAGDDHSDQDLSLFVDCDDPTTGLIPPPPPGA